MPAKLISPAISQVKAFRFAPERFLDCLTEPGIVDFPVAFPSSFFIFNTPHRPSFPVRCAKGRRLSDWAWHRWFTRRHPSTPTLTSCTRRV